MMYAFKPDISLLVNKVISEAYITSNFAWELVLYGRLVIVLNSLDMTH